MNDIHGQISAVLKIRAYRVIWLLLSIFIFSLVFFQSFGKSPDWENYDTFFDSLRYVGWNAVAESRFEPGFVIISVLLKKIFTSNLIIFGVLATSAFYLKCLVINNFSPRRIIFFTAMFFYIVRFVSLHELTQLRAACSISFVMLAFSLIWHGNRIGSFFTFAVAFVFHFSVIIFLPFLFVLWSKGVVAKILSRKNVILIGIVVFVVFKFFIALGVNYFQNKFSAIAMYQDNGFGNIAANPFSVGLLLDWLMVAAGFLMWRHLTMLMKYVLLVELVGMSIFYASLEFQVVAHRFREFFAVFWVFFVAQGLSQKNFVKLISFAIVVSNAVLYSYIYFFKSGFFI